jgi:hypothetical protein
MLFNSVFGILLTCGLTAAHMEMNWPYPMRSQFDPKNKESDIDYDLTSPLESDGMISLSIISSYPMHNRR